MQHLQTPQTPHSEFDSWSSPLCVHRLPESGPGVKALQRPQVMFLDLAWGAQHGQVRYPLFVNSRAVRTDRDPDGQPIVREYDIQQLHETLRLCRQQRLSTRSQKWGVCARLQLSCVLHCLSQGKDALSLLRTLQTSQAGKLRARRKEALAFIFCQVCWSASIACTAACNML